MQDYGESGSEQNFGEILLENLEVYRKYNSFVKNL